ncbi:MAG: zinc metalloprotease HtpX [Candidatus Bathyarchaeia archaeon]
MARLSRLKMSMTMAILLVGIIFAVFLAALMYVVSLFWELPPLGMYMIAIIGAGFFIFIQYLIGPAVVRAATRLRYLKPGENPWLEETVKKYAEKSGLPMPKLAIVPDETPNAFVFGRTASSATLALHEGLLKRLTKEEVEGVIGHELGHLRHKDYLVMTALSAVPLIAYLIARVSFEAMRFGAVGRNRKDSGVVWVAIIAAAFISYIVYIITQLCVLGLSRLREHYADAYSAYLTGDPRQLQSALTKITYGLSLSPKPPSGARTFYIGDPATAKLEFQSIIARKQEYDLDKDGVLDERELELAMEKEAKNTWVKVNSLFTTHPPTYKRILLLREIEKEMETGKFTSNNIYSHI